MFAYFSAKMDAVRVYRDTFLKNIALSGGMISMVWNDMTSPQGKKLARVVLALTLVLSVLNVLTPMVISVLVDSKTDPANLKVNHEFVVWLLSFAAPGREIKDLIPHFIVVGIISFFLLHVVGRVLLFFRGNRSELMVCDNARHVDETVFRKFFEKAVGMHTTHEKLLGEPIVKKGKDKTRNIQDVILWQGLASVLCVSLVYLALLYNFPVDGAVITVGIFFYMLHSVFINQEVLRVCNPLERQWGDYNRYYVERQREFKKVIHNNKAEYEGRKIMKKFDQIVEPDAAFWAYWYPLQNTIRGIVVNMVLTGIVAHGAYRYYHDEISAGFFCSLIAWSTQISASLWEIAQLEHQFNHVTPSILKLKAGFDLPVGIERSANGIILPPDSPFELEFSNVCFSFEGGKDKDGNLIPRQPILGGLSFKVPRGKKVALIAPSGMGKSTTIGLAMGDKDPTSGDILIDGYRLQDLDQGSVLGHIGFVPQEAEIFDGTIFYNMCYGLENPELGSREKAEHLAVMCKMDFLRNGLDTVVGTNGDKLSGGQKQRVGVAMAMMKEPKLFIIDEGTNSLDPTSKREVQGNIDLMLRGDRSGLTVTHDLNAVRHNCDIFLFLDKTEEGRGSSIVAEASSLEELAAKNATFRQFALDQGIVL